MSRKYNTRIPFVKPDFGFYRPKSRHLETSLLRANPSLPLPDTAPISTRNDGSQRSSSANQLNPTCASIEGSA
jgi:hypothetical protein